MQERDYKVVDPNVGLFRLWFSLFLCVILFVNYFVDGYVLPFIL